jgi:hypothetical protein
MAGGLLRRILGQEPERAPDGPRAPTSEDLLAALDRVEAMVRDGAVPPFVESRVQRVVRVVRQTIPRLGSLGAGSAQAYSVMATATDYLPDAVAGYLRLPRDWADSRPVDRGRTSLMVLVDQLDLLAATMERVFDAVCRADATALIAHDRFLQEKFGHASTGGALGLGASAGSGPPPELSGSPVPSASARTTSMTSAGQSTDAHTGTERGLDEDTGPIPIPRLQPPDGRTAP